MITKQFQLYIDDKMQNVKEVLYRTLSRVGELAVNEARTNGSYLDQTGNLRSSIGYIVVDNGNVVNVGEFNEVKGPKESKVVRGEIQGKSFAMSLAQEISGIGLIVVAGMNYAVYVETHRNVLSSAELLAEREVPSLLKQIGLMR